MTERKFVGKIYWSETYLGFTKREYDFQLSEDYSIIESYTVVGTGKDGHHLTMNFGVQLF